VALLCRRRFNGVACGRIKHESERHGETSAEAGINGVAYVAAKIVRAATGEKAK